VEVVHAGFGTSFDFHGANFSKSSIPGMAIRVQAKVAGKVFRS